MIIFTPSVSLTSPYPSSTSPDPHFLSFLFFSILTHHVQFEQPEYSWISFTFSFHMALHAFGGQRTASQSLSFGMGSLGYHRGAYSSLAGPLLAADSPASARISLQVFWVVAVHPHLEFLPGFQGPDPVTRCAQIVLFTRELTAALNSDCFVNMALFSLFVGPFISYLFDDTVFNVVTPSGSLPWLFPSTSSLGWVLGFLSHGRLPGGMSVVLTHFLSSSLGLISWGQDPCPISFPTRRSTGNTLLN